jgi:hypothetical protein
MSHAREAGKHKLCSKAYDPRYGQTDLWNTGMQGRLGVRFTF